MNYKETELTLGLPGGGDFGSEGRFISAVAGFGESSTKLGFAETGDAGFDRESSTNKLKPPRRLIEADDKFESSAKGGEVVVGWPPVRSSRKASTLEESRKYVKVGADGAPYLRKIDLEMYTTYKELLTALQKMFPSFIINGNGAVEYNDHVVTYQDKDGDWMLVGDVPWKMFKESCKRIRVMKQMLQRARN